MGEEWSWANDPMPWCTRSEIREIANEARRSTTTSATAVTSDGCEFSQPEG